MHRIQIRQFSRLLWVETNILSCDKVDCDKTNLWIFTNKNRATKQASKPWNLFALLISINLINNTFNLFYVYFKRGGPAFRLGTTGTSNNSSRWAWNFRFFQLHKQRPSAIRRRVRQTALRHWFKNRTPLKRRQPRHELAKGKTQFE